MIQKFKNIPVLCRWFLGYKNELTPPFVKAFVVKRLARKYKLKVLVETGTYHGYMVNKRQADFKRIYSIELDDVLYQAATAKFKPFNHIKIINGDSAIVLPNILAELTEPALFWLDAHYSGTGTAKGDLDTPILKELAVLAKSEFRHVILIDDARLFNGSNDYPVLKNLIDFVLSSFSDYRVQVNSDIIRLLPN